MPKTSDINATVSLIVTNEKREKKKKISCDDSANAKNEKVYFE
jgi:hypothetical protein